MEQLWNEPAAPPAAVAPATAGHEIERELAAAYAIGEAGPAECE